MVDQNYVAKLEARIEALSVLLCTVVKHNGLGTDQAFLSALESNTERVVDLSLLTQYPEGYLEELRAFSSHLQEWISRGNRQ